MYLMRVAPLRHLLFILLFLSAPALAWGQNLDKEQLDDLIGEWEERMNNKDTEGDDSTLGMLEDIRDSVSEDIQDLASRIDSFFVNENVVYGRNTTNVRVFNTLDMVEGEGMSGGLDFKIRLQLPRLKNRFQFEVERQLDDYSVDGQQRPLTNTTFNKNREGDQRTRAGFSFFNNVKTVQSKFTVGMEYNKGFDPYGNLRFSKKFKVSPSQNFQLITNFYAGVQDKTRQRTTTYYDIGLKNNILFRVLNEGTYKDKENTYETLHALNLFLELNDRNTISYIAAVRGLNEAGDDSFFANEYFVGNTLRRRMYKQFLYLEITPGLSWPKIRDFHSVWQMTLRLEVIFGNI